MVQHTHTHTHARTHACMSLNSGNYLLNQSALTLTSTVNEQLMAQSVCAHTFENDVICFQSLQMDTRW
jgi:hypothetical protein